MVTSIDKFESSTPLNYPGQRHDGNFLLVDGEALNDVSQHPAEALAQFDELLAEKGLPLIADRIPVLAFGRNASPTGAASKIEKFGHGEMTPGDLGTVPMLRGALPAHDVVWHGRPGQVGNYFAELIDTPKAPDAHVEVWVQFLSTEQLAIIHTSEGLTYELSEIPHVDLGDGIVIDTVGYTAREASVALDENGRPISVAGIDRDGHDGESLTVREMLEKTLGSGAVELALGKRQTADEYITEGQGMKLKERKARQTVVDTALIEQSLKRPFRYEGEGLRFGRADFTSLPRGITGEPSHQTLIPMMEQHIAAIRPSKEALENGAVDPAKLIRKRATDELLDAQREARLRANITPQKQD